MASKTSEKTKLFISYSRKDRGRIERLYDALASEEDLRVFRDTDDILPTEEWKPRLEKLIRESDTIIFALSPASAASEVCAWELELAASLNKRIIPIVVENVDGAVPEAVSKLNYIFLTEADDFGRGLTKIQDAISLDIDWVREHTRLGELADRWEKAVRLGAQPLRGKELEAAERWLVEQPKNAPQPTELQRRYILESRKAATRRARITVMGSVAAMLIVGVLGVFAWVQRGEAVAQKLVAEAETQRAELAQQEAETQRGEAVAQKTVAEERTNDTLLYISNQLAAQRRIADSLKVSLAVHSKLGSNKKHSAFLPALSKALTASTLPNVWSIKMHSREEISRGIFLKSNGPVFVTTEGRSIRIYENAKDHTTMEEFRWEYDIQLAETSPLGTILVLASTSGEIGIFDLENRVFHSERFQTRDPREISFASSGLSATVLGYYQILSIDFAGLNPRGTLFHQSEFFDQFSISDDGKFFAAVTPEESTILFEMLGSYQIEVCRLPASSYSDVAISDSGKYLVTQSHNYEEPHSISIWDQHCKEVVRLDNSFLGRGEGVSNLKFSGGDKSVHATTDGEFVIWDAQDGRKVNKFETSMLPFAVDKLRSGDSSHDPYYILRTFDSLSIWLAWRADTTTSLSPQLGTMLWKEQNLWELGENRSLDGSLILTNGPDGFFRFWSTEQDFPITSTSFGECKGGINDSANQFRSNRRAVVKIDDLTELHYDNSDTSRSNVSITIGDLRVPSKLSPPPDGLVISIDYDTSRKWLLVSLDNLDGDVLLYRKSDRNDDFELINEIPTLTHFGKDYRSQGAISANFVGGTGKIASFDKEEIVLWEPLSGLPFKRYAVGPGSVSRCGPNFRLFTSNEGLAFDPTTFASKSMFELACERRFDGYEVSALSDEIGFEVGATLCKD